MDGSESVRSGRSDRSEHSRRSGHRHRHHGTHRHSSRASDREGRERDRERDDRSVTIKMPGNVSENEDQPLGEERIEVHILPQDDNWGDNTTAITGER